MNERILRPVVVAVVLWAVCLSTVWAENATWSSAAAQTLPEGRWEIGLFQPLRYGQTDHLEWSTHPILNLVIPNLSVKIAHGAGAGWQLATRHQLHYPTPLLRLVRREGTGGLIAPDLDIPAILFLRSELLLTRNLGSSRQLTVKGGAALVAKTRALDERATIDLPIIFPRMAAYRQGYQVNFGLDLVGKLLGRWGYGADMDVFLTPGFDQPFAFEHKGLALWRKNDRFQLLLGYKLTFGDYPFGEQWHLLPLLDLQWSRKRQGRQ